jgi:hypothetical protein
MKLQYWQPAKNQPKSHFLFHKNFSLRNCVQSHYIEVEKGDIFTEQKMSFWLVGNTEKKFWADYEQLWGQFFHVFKGKKNIVAFSLKSFVISIKKNSEFF